MTPLYRAALVAALSIPARALAQPGEPALPAEAPTEVAPTAPAAPVVVDRPPAAGPRLVLELELVTQARWARRTGDDLTDLRLDRGELGARLALGPHAAGELRVEAIRSAVEGGTLGIDGDSTVIRVKYAQVTGAYALGPATVEGALGFVPDPWIRALEAGYTLKPLSRTASERLLGWPTSDLSALARVAVGPARLAVTIGNGEGLRFPERNTGKTTTAVLDVIALERPAARVTLAAVGRDGSLGVASIRDRRAGGGASVVTPFVRAGVEAVRAWGIGDRGEAEGWAFGGWAEGRIVERDAWRVLVAARGATLGFDDAGRRSTFGGALALEPFADLSGPRPARVRVWLAVDRVTSSGGAMPLPGADAGDATLVMVLASATAPFSID